MKDFHDIAQRSLASQDKWELEQLLIEVDKIKPQNILEIGVHMGHGMRHLKEAFSPTVLIGLERDTCYEYPELTVLKGVDSHSEETLETVKKMCPSFDFIFIDGDHSYEGAKKDFEMYAPLVRKDGIIAFHDARVTDNETCDVYKFWNEIKRKYVHREIFNPKKEGTGVGVLWV